VFAQSVPKQCVMLCLIVGCAEEERKVGWCWASSATPCLLDTKYVEGARVKACAHTRALPQNIVSPCIRTSKPNKRALAPVWSIPQQARVLNLI